MEEIIGTWKDGKPIYKQTFSTKLVGATSNDSSSYVNTDINLSSLNLKKVIKLETRVQGKNDNNYCPSGNSYTKSINTCLITHIQNNTNNQPVIRCRNNQKWLNGYSWYATLYYTKTTD